jgi:hypothetical protein
MFRSIPGVIPRLAWFGAVAVLLGACMTPVVPPTTAPDATTTSRPQAIEETTSTASGEVEVKPSTTEPVPTTSPLLTGKVVSPSGTALAGSTVSAGDAKVTTGEDGGFQISMGVLLDTPITITRPGWMSVTYQWDAASPLNIALEPRTVRGLRVSPAAAGNQELFSVLLDMAERSSINTFVFDTKEEGGRVVYASNVVEANEIGAVDPAYDPVAAIAESEYAGIYTVSRVVVFEDEIRAQARPDLRLAGVFLDPGNRDAWEYPIDLAAEACQLGFDEIQFDYVRYPSSIEGGGLSEEERVNNITAFLAQAAVRLHQLGCAVSADVFGIVLSTDNDQGIGQRPEEISAVVDAFSPMIYPSHYSDGWLGFDKPNDHPGPVVADALDDGLPRVAPTSVMRPWLQAFYYGGEQVRAQIAEAEERGTGWILWNVRSEYGQDWVPGEE